ncbi:MAG: hypothetical protein NVSMB3_09340 [Acidobacteriaceae bacterium]
MDSRAGCRRMNDQAGKGVGVVGQARALVRGERSGGVGEISFAGRKNRESRRGEQGSQATAEGAGYIFFGYMGREMRSRVGAAVRGIKEDEIAVDYRWRLGAGRKTATGAEEREQTEVCDGLRESDHSGWRCVLIVAGS